MTDLWSTAPWRPAPSLPFPDLGHPLPFRPESYTGRPRHDPQCLPRLQPNHLQPNHPLRVRWEAEARRQEEERRLLEAERARVAEERARLEERFRKDQARRARRRQRQNEKRRDKLATQLLVGHWPHRWIDTPLPGRAWDVLLVELEDLVRQVDEASRHYLYPRYKAQLDYHVSHGDWMRGNEAARKLQGEVGQWIIDMKARVETERLKSRAWAFKRSVLRNPRLLLRRNYAKLWDTLTDPDARTGRDTPDTVDSEPTSVP